MRLWNHRDSKMTEKTVRMFKSCIDFEIFTLRIHMKNNSSPCKRSTWDNRTRLDFICTNEGDVQIVF